MKVHKGYEGLSIVHPVVTLGIFDGVHTGHRALLSLVRQRAAENMGQSVVVTFDPHPRQVLKTGALDMSLLTTMEEKVEHLDASGIDHLVILDFSREFSNMEACDFVSEILMNRIGTKHLIMGYDHRFGRRGEGDIEKIRRCQGTSGLTIEQAEPVLYNGEPVSSTLIRSYLLDGKPEIAAELLGYEYSLSGIVIEGKKIGRSFGFPTANIKPQNNKLVPSEGVYAVWVKAGDTNYMGMLSIGSNPTVNKDSRTRSIEVHILDFEGDIYGSNITLKFVRKLRNERKFASLQQLSMQMEVDRQETIRLLK
ncbi:MAG TPA: bifunctional riboflavin kinase/FAD synthetase [Bacteroidales bacterium]|nr:bifunctional riboflavin kinase/FAD synthetase [Bacteroidales bacterium]